MSSYFGVIVAGRRCIQLLSACIGIHENIDNFKRSAKEVEDLMRLAEQKYNELAKENGLAEREGLEMRMLGDLSIAPPSVQGAAARLMRETAAIRNKKALLNICFSYTSGPDVAPTRCLASSLRGGLGATEELVSAVDTMQRAVSSSHLHPDDITPSLLPQLLHSSDCPPVDLLIRTSGETRLSDFLLWQSSHAQLCFVDRLWPDLSFCDFARCILSYQRGAAHQQAVRQRCTATCLKHYGAGVQPQPSTEFSTSSCGSAIRSLTLIIAELYSSLVRGLLPSLQTPKVAAQGVGLPSRSLWQHVLAMLSPYASAGIPSTPCGGGDTGIVGQAAEVVDMASVGNVEQALAGQSEQATTGQAIQTEQAGQTGQTRRIEKGGRTGLTGQAGNLAIGRQIAHAGDVAVAGTAARVGQADAQQLQDQHHEAEQVLQERQELRQGPQISAQQHELDEGGGDGQADAQQHQHKHQAAEQGMQELRQSPQTSTQQHEPDKGGRDEPMCQADFHLIVPCSSCTTSELKSSKAEPVDSLPPEHFLSASRHLAPCCSAPPSPDSQPASSLLAPSFSGRTSPDSQSASSQLAPCCSGHTSPDSILMLGSQLSPDVATGAAYMQKYLPKALTQTSSLAGPVSLPAQAAQSAAVCATRSLSTSLPTEPLLERKEVHLALQAPRAMHRPCSEVPSEVSSSKEGGLDPSGSMADQMCTGLLQGGCTPEKPAHTGVSDAKYHRRLISAKGAGTESTGATPVISVSIPFGRDSLCRRSCTRIHRKSRFRVLRGHNLSSLTLGNSSADPELRAFSWHVSSISRPNPTLAGVLSMMVSFLLTALATGEPGPSLLSYPCGVWRNAPNLKKLC
eukprot:gene30942-35997_t